jgi:hypothetical protein
MQRPYLLPFAAAFLAATPLLAAEPLAWPWTSKTPSDPALMVLPKVESVTGSLDDTTLKLTVKAVAPTTGFSELALSPRIGDPKDRVFAFDIRGRAPQEVAAPAETQVSLDVTFTGAPSGKFDIVEIHAKENCQGYSLTAKNPVACSAKSVPQ